MDTWRETAGRKLNPFYGCMVDTVVVTGNARTKRVTIVREMATKQGGRLDEELIYRDSAYLRGLGFFSDVEISAGRTDPGRCRVLVKVTERPGLFMKYPYPVVNYDLEDGLSYGFRWKVKNFRGFGEELGFSALKRRDREHGGDASWNIPWVKGRRLRLNFKLFTYRRLEEPQKDDFIKERNGTMLSVGLPLSRSLVRQIWFNASFSFEGRHSRLPEKAGSEGEIGRLYRQNMLSVGFALLYDSRDNRLTAGKGLISMFSVKRVTSVYGLDQDYIFYRLANYVYIPVGWMGTLILAVDGDVREGDLPSFFEMGLGGFSDLRGYDIGDERGAVKVLGTVQLRKRLFGPHVFNIPRIGKFDLAINAVVFVDNGSLMDSIDDMTGSRYYTTGGLGIEFLSPIQDLIRLEVAACKYDKPIVYVTSGIRF